MMMTAYTSRLIPPLYLPGFTCDKIRGGGFLYQACGVGLVQYQQLVAGEDFAKFQSLVANYPTFYF